MTCFTCSCAIVNAAPVKMASCTGILKVLVSFYRHGEEQAFERHRSRVSFDQEKQLSINAVKNHLKDFGLSELTKKFGMPDYEIKLFRLSRSSGGKVENYSIVTQQQWEMEIPLLLAEGIQSELNGE